MKCAKCGNQASKYNKTGIPVCSRHAKAKISQSKCPNCGLGMAIREGKFGNSGAALPFQCATASKSSETAKQRKRTRL